MFVEGIAFLISVGKPLDLCMVTVLGSGVGTRNSQAMRTAMTSHYNAYQSRHFKIKMVVMDGESSAAKAALETEFQHEVEFAPLPAGVHDPIVESLILRLKEGVRSIIQGLPFPTSRPLLAWIVMYVVYITNLMPKRHGFGGGAVCARQDFTGIRPDIRRDLPYAFGQYLQATSGIMDNSMKPRTFSAITLMPTGSGNGSVRIMNLNTGIVCTRTPSQLTQLPMPQEWIEILVL